MPRSLLSGAYLVLFFILLVANVSIYWTLFAPRALDVRVLDVGEKGSAILVRTPSKETILIDAGPDASILRALGTAIPPWQRQIDLVILTCVKKVCIGGLPDVSNRYKVLQNVTLTQSQRLVLGNNTYIDISISKNAPAGVSVSNRGEVMKIR